jgi:cell division protein ZapD
MASAAQPPQTATYEQPLNERVRTLLRLEFLFRQARHGIKGDSEWHSRQVIAALLDVLGVLSARGDVRAEIIKELDRMAITLGRLEHTPGVDQPRLHSLLEECSQLADAMKSVRGLPGGELKANELLTSVMQRIGIPGGTCGFDLPAFHHWLLRPATERRAQLDEWLAAVDNLRRATNFILRVLRDSASPRALTAQNGVYQQNLDRNTPYQLLRVHLPADAPYFAEVSGSKHFFTVRFMLQTDTRERPTATAEPVQFQLSCCAL